MGPITTRMAKRVWVMVEPNPHFQIIAWKVEVIEGVLKLDGRSMNKSRLRRSHGKE